MQFKVIDVDKVIVRGDGLGLVPTNRTATFTITAPDAHLSDIDVAITSMFKQCLCISYVHPHSSDSSLLARVNKL